MNDNLLFLNGKTIEGLFAKQEATILELVKQAYLAQHHGHANLPGSTFLRFPDKERERIISLPAYLGAPFNCAGMKWIASFPDNVKQNKERASALFILNSLETGHPLAVMESSIISAKRTAASAAMTASLAVKDCAAIETVAVIGTGLINFETVTFLMHLFRNIKTIQVFDINAERAKQFSSVIVRHFPNVQMIVCDNYQQAMLSADIIAIATTAVSPYIQQLDHAKSDAVILHTSLRDLAPEIILASNNIVDDVSHAISANTSCQLAYLQVQSTNFINCTIGQLLEDGQSTYFKKDRRVIISPFGMGTLDLALAHYLYHQATQKDIGIHINEFFPQPWFQRTA